MNEPNRPKEKIIFPGEPGYKYSEAAIKDSMSRIKKLLLANPGKKLSEICNRWSKETYDETEKIVREKWDEIEVR
ncbi:hypothetical protein FACS18942_00710 [Planctomycetales bacterium]|nr:hypothetical protein FACS18942_00710 [Planctomycetales bacterium]GHT34612.1 hypothetical protein FACS189427_02220 [Planctomycetales bacterium]